MPRLENPFPHIAVATDAATRIVSIHTELYMLKQELKAMKQVKRAVWLGVGLIILNLLLTLSLYWVEMGLHELGWSSFSLALLTIVFFGILAGLSLYSALRVSQTSQK